MVIFSICIFNCFAIVSQGILFRNIGMIEMIFKLDIKIKISQAHNQKTMQQGKRERLFGWLFNSQEDLLILEVYLETFN
jgi:hypothetical protein